MSRGPKKFLKKPGGRVLHWSKELSAREGYVECDRDGNIIDSFGGIAAGIGIAKAKPKPEPKAEDTVKASMEQRQKEIDSAVMDETEAADDIEYNFDNMKASEIVQAAKEKFGEEADYLRHQFGKEKLIEEWGRLEAMLALK